MLRALAVLYVVLGQGELWTLAVLYAAQKVVLAQRERWATLRAGAIARWGQQPPIQALPHREHSMSVYPRKPPVVSRLNGVAL